jgi:predicted house-cleaning noncanonical NTP pyrophosphatase (MazG superfamily)
MTKYNKLVRDKIPEGIKRNKEVPKIHIANEEEYWEKLKEKLHEEIEEFYANESEEELADILEVTEAICKFKKWDKKKIDKIKENKAKKKGSFNERIILDEIWD